MSRIDTPTLTVCEAVRRSCAIPWFFESPQDPKTKVHYVDGGVFDNFPIDYFGRDDAVLGLTFETEWDNVTTEPEPITSFKEYAMSILNGYAIASANTHSQLGNKVIKLPTCNITLTDFNLTIAQKKELYEEAKKATFNYIIDHK